MSTKSKNSDVAKSFSEQEDLFALIRLELLDVASEAEQALTDLNVSRSNLVILERNFNKLILEYEDAWSDCRLCLTQKGQDEATRLSREHRAESRDLTRTLASLNDRISASTQPNPIPNPSPTPKVVPSLPTPKFSELEIKSFDGNLAEWPTFWDTFESLIHTNSDLTDVIKFALLRKYLKGRAFKVVEGLSVTNSNYDVAVQALLTTFKAPERLLSRLIREFDNLAPPRHNYDELFDFKLEMDSLVAQINNLSPQDTDSILFREIILKKLPAETFKVLFNKYHTPTPTFEQIKEGLMCIIQCMDLCKEQPKPEKRNEVVVRSTSVTAKPKDVLTQKKSSNLHSSPNNANPASKTSYNSNLVGKHPSNCIFCNQAHSSKYCPQYSTLDARRNRVQNLNLCFCCLKPGHRVGNCSLKFECRNCNGTNHHTFLCAKLCSPVQNPVPSLPKRSPNPNPVPYPYKSKSPDPSSIPSSNVNTAAVSSSCKNVPAGAVNTVNLSVPSSTSCDDSQVSVALPTATVTLSGGGSRENTRMCLDSCCQRSFIQSELAKKLKLPIVSRVEVRLSVFGQPPETIVSDVVKVVVRIGNSRIRINAICHEKTDTVITIPGITKVIQFLSSNGVKLADPSIRSDEITDIGLLVGAQHYSKFVTNISRVLDIEVMTCPSGAMVFGPLPDWAVSHSNVISRDSVTVQHVTCARNCSDTSIFAESVDVREPSINHLWKLDTIGITDEPFSPEERLAVNKFEESINFQENIPTGSRYSVDLPFKSSLRPPTNYNRAVGQLASLASSFKKNPEYFDQYTNILNEYEHKGFIERVSGPVTGHYLPHHGVKKDSITTPLRIVFNASCRDAKTRTSLNDCLLTGPSLTSNLFDSLLAFRTNPFAVVSDISKAFLRIGINDSCRDFCRFLMFSDLTCQELITYRFCVVLFGATCSPFLLQKTLIHHLENHSHPLCRTLIPCFYVDNFCKTYVDVDSMLLEYPTINHVLLDANMPLQTWVSNSSQFNELVEADVSNPNVNILGLIWNIHRDDIHIKYNSKIVISDPHKLTKRKVVSALSSIFDPLGLISPLLVRGKIFIQKLWLSKFSWDDELPQDLCYEFESITSSLIQCSDIPFPRFVVVPNQCDLHIFCDASMRAYGAVAYATNSQSSNLLLAKARVAPHPTLSIPKLELTALTLGCKLAKSLLANPCLSFHTCTLWSDSEVVLHWVHKNLCSNTYVRNRVSEIIDSQYQVLYVPTAENPADLITRGTTLSKLQESALWYNGPTWLPSKNFPLQKSFTTVDVVVDEILVEPQVIIPSLPLVEVKNYSSLFDIVRAMRTVISACKKFCSNLPRKADLFHTSKLPLFSLVRMEQQFSYATLWKYLSGDNCPRISDDLKNFAAQLGLYMSEDNLIRSAGRLKNSSLCFSTQNPVLLPPKSALTKLIVNNYHLLHHHASVNNVLVMIRELFWLPKARQTIKSILYDCVLCKKVNKSTLSRPPPPPLPEERVEFVRPFHATGVDFTGAYQFIDPETDELAKAYVCLFTCTSSRAVHLELLHTLTTQEFLLAFRRFCASHSVPSIMISDNGTNFLGCHNFLKQISDEPEVRSHMNDRQIVWKFNTPRSPWSGGFFERLISVVKGCLSKSLYRRKITFEELRTILCEIQTIVNNRPLTYVSGERDDEYLTPNHLLFGRNIVLAPPLNELTNDDSPYRENIDLRVQYSRLSTVLKNFEQMWKKDYLTSLRERHYGNHPHSIESCPLKVNDIVLVNLEDLPRAIWPLGKVTRIIPSKDDIVRTVEVLVGNKFYERSITKIVPLEISLSDVELEIPHFQVTESPQVNSFPPPPPRPRRKAAQRAAELRKDLIQNDLL